MNTCQFCTRQQAAHKMLDGYEVCDACLPTVKRYYSCRICNKEVNASQASSARKQFTPPICGTIACQRQEDINHGRLCCDKAEYTPCVCHYSYRCEEHHPNGVHVGTHD